MLLAAAELSDLAFRVIRHAHFAQRTPRNLFVVRVKGSVPGDVAVPSHQDYVPYRHGEVPVNLAALRHVGHPAAGMFHDLVVDPNFTVVTIHKPHHR